MLPLTINDFPLFSVGSFVYSRPSSSPRLTATSDALASDIVLACRPLATNAGVVSRRDFLTDLKRELPPALHHLQQGNIAPVDLAQAAIGPGERGQARVAGSGAA